VAAYKKRDLNRYIKVYPYVRFPPRYVYEYDEIVAPGVADVEAGKITFTNAESGTYTYTGTYSTVPSVVITTVDTAGNSGTNVSVTITSISTTTATVSASAAFTGQVHIHVVAV
jgi:hypothetical protein